MMDKEEYEKAFYAFYEAIINERHWDSLRLPRDIAFYRFCFNEAVAGRMTGKRLEGKGVQLAKLFLLGYQLATGKQIIQRIERVYFNSVGDMEND